MKIFVLYDRSGIHSGRVLGRHLIQRLAGKATVRRGRPSRLIELQEAGKTFDYIINVGWYKRFDPKGAVVLNVPEAIRLSSNKRNARVRFRSKNVPAPQLWLKYDAVWKKDLPVIARTTHHTKGRGLWFCQTQREVDVAHEAGATHYLKFVPNIREFRVHAMAPKPELGRVDESAYRVIKVSEKLPRGSASREDVVKNHENGWFFGYPANKKDPVLGRVRSVAKKAIKTFGLHWGAVDIMVSRDTGELYVLEINSTPCLTDDQANTLERYSNSLCILLGLEPLPVKKKRPNLQPLPIKRTKKVVKSSHKLKALLGRRKL